jgi:hypothetical protein
MDPAARSRRKCYARGLHNSLASAYLQRSQSYQRGYPRWPHVTCLPLFFLPSTRFDFQLSTVNANGARGEEGKGRIVWDHLQTVCSLPFSRSATPRARPMACEARKATCNKQRDTPQGLNKRTYTHAHAGKVNKGQKKPRCRLNARQSRAGLASAWRRGRRLTVPQQRKGPLGKLRAAFGWRLGQGYSRYRLQSWSGPRARGAARPRGTARGVGSCPGRRYERCAHVWRSHFEIAGLASRPCCDSEKAPGWPSVGFA